MCTLSTPSPGAYTQLPFSFFIANNRAPFKNKIVNVGVVVSHGVSLILGVWPRWAPLSGVTFLQ